MNSTNNFRRFRLALGATIGLWIAGTLHGDTIFTYQGELMENGNLANGAYDMDFLLWDALAGGNQVGSTIQINGVLVTDGRFTVELDFGAAALDNSNRWLEVAVNGITLAPRQPITRVPYAIQTRGLFVDDDEHVGIGVTNPFYPLQVKSDTQLTAHFSNQLVGAGSGTAVLADVTSDEGMAIYGVRYSGIGSAPAILGETYSSADNATAIRGVIASAEPGFESAAVQGRNLGLNNSGFGVSGSHEGSGSGVFGSSVDGDGVYGLATGGSSINCGVKGETYSNTFGIGVYGIAQSSGGNNDGVYGETLSPGGRGVVGLHNSYSGIAPGVMGASNSSTDFAVGVHGIIESETPGSSSAAVRGENDGMGAAGIGVWGSQNGSGFGVYGTSPAGIGVYGLATGSSGVNYGVYGRSDSAGGYDFFAAGAGQNYGSASSRRWKTNIEPIDGPLDKLSRIRGVYYDWDQEHGGHHDVGMIAEEVGEVLPEIVQYEANGIDASGMDYSKLTPLLVEAVKELNKKHQKTLTEHLRVMTDARKENEDLRERLANLESLVLELKAQTIEERR